MASQNFYKQNGSYFKSGSNQKILNPTELAGYAKLGGKEVAYQAPAPIPVDATKILNKDGLLGLNESQIYRQGKDIYKLPTTVSSDVITGTTPKIEPVTLDPISVSSLMAGANTSNEGIKAQLEARNAVLPEQTVLKDNQDKASAYAETQKTAQTDLLNKKLNQYGLDANVEQVQQIMPQIAKTTAEFNSLQEQNANLPIANRIIGGTQDRLMRQKAIEVAGLSAVAQAYQGNVNMARNLAKDAINAQYQDQTTYIDNLNSQIQNSYTDLTAAEKKRADELLIVNNERIRNIEVEKEVKTNINNLAITAAQNGADPATVKTILSSKTEGEAIINSGQYIKVPEKSSVSWDTFSDTSSGETKLVNRFTGEVKNIGQANTNLGSPVGEVMGLPTYNTRAENPGVTRSDRNNNPGNIKVSVNTKNWAGVIGVENNTAEDGGNFLIFDSPESGIGAIGRLLQTDGYSGMSAEKAIKRYNGNGAYGAISVGLDPNKDFQSQIQDPAKLKSVAAAIAKAEGFTGTNGNKPNLGIDEIASNNIKAGIKVSDAKGKDTAETALIQQSMTKQMAAGLTPEAQKIKSDAIQKTLKTEIEKIDEAISSPGFRGAVGTIGLTRRFLSGNMFTGNVDNTVAMINSIVSNQALKDLTDAKAGGATFGALSDRELDVLSSANTTLSQFAKHKDDKADGKILYYDNSEKNVKAELERLKAASLRLMVANGGKLSGEDGNLPQIQQFLIVFPEKKVEYNSVTSANPELTDEEILQVLTSN